ncbi:hypothetical protein [Streptomyces sp. SID3915]|uniref:hypothetical protein n=1 Tax=Streptomyces sp. SID3915 TaxID=2690263 RepID=UPI001368D9DA|nr:hypothetical protein [Streptomyces sp. SID3915]MYX77073.1 hypothetical protein [Streptomyces sp. SID3915]
MLNYHIVGGLLTPIPIAGDAIRRSVDAGLNNHLNDENARVDAETRNNMIRHYDYSEKQMYGMLRKMATERSLSKNELDASPGEYEDHLQAITEQWYQNGMGDADKWMGQ